MVVGAASGVGVAGPAGVGGVAGFGLMFRANKGHGHPDCKAGPTSGLVWGHEPCSCKTLWVQFKRSTSEVSSLRTTRPASAVNETC